MKAPFSALTQSQYFHSAFNSAIFDGPVRIYFVQFHETYALKIYFALQDELAPMFNSVKDYSKDASGNTVLLMVYPTAEVFAKAFPQSELLEVNGKYLHYGKEQWEEEDVIGVIAEESEELISTVVAEVKKIFDQWNEKKNLTSNLNGQFANATQNNGFVNSTEDYEGQV